MFIIIGVPVILLFQLYYFQNEIQTTNTSEKLIKFSISNPMVIAISIGEYDRIAENTDVADIGI